MAFPHEVSTGAVAATHAADPARTGGMGPLADKLGDFVKRHG
jgi:hypothetical protein